VSNFSKLDLTAYAKPTTAADQIRSGDRIKLTVDSGSGEEDAIDEWTVAVDDNGEAAVPTIGRIQLAGLSQTQAEQSIIDQSIQRDVYLTPAVDLQIDERRENSIVVAGAVESPGAVTFPESSLTLADVIVRAGGLTPAASGLVSINSASSNWDAGDQLTPVSTEQSNGNARRLNLSTTSAAELSAITIPPGALVNVELTGDRSIHVIGVIGDRAVKIPAGTNVRLLDALSMAGGPTYSHWITDRIDIIRRVPGKEETVRIRASIRKAKKDDSQNLLLAANDIVSVEENAFSFVLSALGGLAGVTNAARAAAVP